MTVLSLLAFYGVMYSDRGYFPEGIWFMLFAPAGVGLPLLRFTQQQNSCLPCEPSKQCLTLTPQAEVKLRHYFRY
ncbi:MAG: hypothetical protein H6656_15695 [Ardenticatenaceae bacterium]|nr:hypothetical protein [Ardenticatenaceae bacterium]